jgi:two-component system chemotaxis response regulator CheY
VLSALVVDDARMMRLLLASSLTDLGYEVIQAANGKEALEALDKSPSIALALIDWHMPVMNGLDCIKAVRADPRFSTLIVVMVTVETEMERIVAALEAGANDYIMKPVTPEMIEEKLLLLGLSRGQIA